MVQLLRSPIIGVSARIAKPQADHAGRLSRTTNTLDQSLAQWLGSLGLIPVLIPSMLHSNLTTPCISAADYATICDGLILQGGADVSPKHYGQTPLHLDWSGDEADDAYEMGLVDAFLGVGKPIFGICRGMQLMNVFFGGSLYQDVSSQIVNSKPHSTQDREKHTHLVSILPNTTMQQWFGCKEGMVVSSHHQAVCILGERMDIQSLSDDGIVEAIHWRGESFMAGVQWHPEFHHVHSAKSMLCSEALMDPFKNAVYKRRALG